MNFTYLLLALLSIAFSTATPLSKDASLDISAHKASKTPNHIDFSTTNHHASPSWPHRSTLALTNLTLPTGALSLFLFVSIHTPISNY